MTRELPYERSSSDTLAVGLGWFSIALGIAELAAPQRMARLIGVPPTERTLAMLRAFGARELGNGLAVLADPGRSAWMWSRVAGDAVDLASLGRALNAPGTDRGRTIAATAAVLGVTALDVLCARQLAAQEQLDQALSDRRPALGTAAMPGDGAKVRIHEAITLNAPIERVEESWADLDTMPESLRSLACTSHGSDERCIIEFRQAPGGRGTEVRLELEYRPRFGAIGRAVARLTGGDPTGQLRQDLRRFKQIIETGEVTLSDGPSLWRPAQPPASRQDARHAAGIEVQA